jgi:hypothetical protein
LQLEKKDIFILLGFGLGYLALDILKKPPDCPSRGPLPASSLRENLAILLALVAVLMASTKVTMSLDVLTWFYKVRVFLGIKLNSGWLDR